MLPLWAELAILLLSLAALLYQGIAVLFAYQMPRLDPAPEAAPRTWPSLSVVIAARNEADDLGPCLDALLAQDYPGPMELQVVDGRSTDGTPAVAEARAPRVRLLVEPPLPDGWVGKNWALDQGARATRGEWILFLDADVRCHPAAVRTVLAWAERETADLATIAPTVEAVGFWERVVLPFYVQMVLTFFRAPRVNRPESSAAMANGQFLLIRRSTYDAVGGHAAIRSAIVEDVRLAEAVKRSHHLLRVAWAPELARTRMYREPREMFEGTLRTVQGSGVPIAYQFAFLAGLVGFFWLPLLVLPIGLVEGSVALVVWGAVLWGALFAKHIGFTRTTGSPWAYGLLFPVAVAFYLRVVATAIARELRRRPVVWKGRSYPTGP
jgi:chlorobactene glucosyltransferase